MPGRDCKAAGAGIEPVIWDNEGQVAFGEPWQAQIFSMTVALHEAGLFGWSTWAEVFSGRRRASSVEGKPDTSQTYYEDWLDALETLTASLDLAPQAEQARYRKAWRDAAERTKHGHPIELQPADFHGRLHP